MRAPSVVAVPMFARALLRARGLGRPAALRRPLATVAGATPVTPPPTKQQLYRHALGAAVPMVGFGFMDNTVMLQMGNTLDCTIGVAFGLSTLSAAAMGQACSDVAGILFGDTVERMCSALGLPPSGLTLEQRRMPRSKRIALLGSCVGVVCGCCLGMVNVRAPPARAPARARARAAHGAPHPALPLSERALRCPPPGAWACGRAAAADRHAQGGPAQARRLLRWALVHHRHSRVRAARAPTPAPRSPPAAAPPRRALARRRAHHERARARFRHGFTVAVDNARAVLPPDADADEDESGPSGPFARGRPAATRVVVRGPLPASAILSPVLSGLSESECDLLSASASVALLADPKEGTPEHADAELLVLRAGAVVPPNAHRELSAKLLAALEGAAGSGAAAAAEEEPPPRGGGAGEAEGGAPGLASASGAVQAGGAGDGSS